MELNRVELALKEIYDGWQLGNECENNGYSAMFRMGFPDEYINSDRPLLMYVGQEDLDGKPHKTQAWVRKYQIVQRTQTYNKEIDRGSNKSPFWELYRKLDDMGYNCLWDNLDKFLKADHKEHLGKEEAVAFNAPYGEDGISVLQREIELLKPNIVLLAIGPKEKYRRSLASALSVEEKVLRSYKPTRKNCVNDISAICSNGDTIVLWTYHPKYLRLSKLETIVLNKIQQIIDTK